MLDIPIEEEPEEKPFINLPDAIFEERLIAQGIDSDGTINQKILEEDALAVTALDLFYAGSDPDQKITDLTGIEGFKNLEELIVGNNALTSVEFNGNIALKKLYLNANQINSIDLTNNPALTFVSISRNELQEIDLSTNVNLEYLNLDDNRVKVLDVSHNRNLIELNAIVNELTSVIGLEKTISLKTLNLSWNDLEELVINLPALEGLNVEQNLLTKLDIGGCIALTSLIATNNFLTQLDLNTNVSLQYLKMSANKIAQLDLSRNLVIELLWISNNQLTKLDISQLPKLYELSIFGNADLRCIKVLSDQMIATLRKEDYQELNTSACK